MCVRISLRHPRGAGKERLHRVVDPPLQAGRLIEEEGGEGMTVWASFNWVRPVELETALEQQKQLTELVDASQLVVKTAAIEEAIDEWMPSELRRVQSAHSAIILASEEGLALSRATPMPLS